MLAQIVIDSTWALATLAGAGGVIALLFRLLISSKDREIALVITQKDKAILDLERLRESYREIADEAIKSAKDTAEYWRRKEGKPPIPMVAPVISEGNSPSTQAQREAATIQTMRATLAAIKLAVGQEPRPEPEHAVEK